MSKHDFRPTFEEPIRDEIFSAERLEQFATYLAREVKVTTSRHLGRSLLPQIKKNHEFLVEAYHDLIDAVEQGESIPPAGEWIIDNFHIVEEQIREIQQDLPESFYRELPKLNDGDLTDYPRVYAIALALLAHTDSRLEVETIKRFLAAFQTVSPLQIGELWAVAIHLRIALVENMRRIAAQVIHIELLKRQASKIVDHLLSADEISEREIQKHADEIHVLLERASPCECALLSLITQKMRDQDPKFLPIVEGLNRFCSFRNQKIDDAIREDHQQQSLTQATTRNIVQSMRLLSTIDWQAFFESVSQVDKILALDPASAYSKMDFESRNRYRDVIERISKRTGVDEISIAEVAIDLSVQAKKNTQDPKREHVGYFLVDRGLEILENRFRYRPTALERIRGFLKNHPYFAYFFPLLSLSIIGVFPFLFYARHYGAPVWIQITATGIALVPISDIALNIVNLFLSSLLPPRVLQKLDFSQGIPEGEKTIVVVPVIFQDAASVTKAIENLEIRFIANQDANLTFALLSDFPDAESETTDADPLILTALKEGIDRLNRHYTTEQPIFYSFYRRRLWSDSEGKWLGWERKRGKLHEFNRFLRGLDSSTFVATSKFDPFLFNIKYVITLDADTQLPRNTARKLVGTICHPLNTPQIDSKSGLVTQGYGVLQPRISISLESANRSFFSRIFSGHTGIDPYTTAVSDVYQDLFGEGIYTGKGLYVIDAFETSLASRVPESCLLSHDLFEGEHARTALLSDIELLDDYPSHYESFARRQHRWTRGDWQIIEWLFPRVRNAAGERTKNLLSLLSRWKIFDNLRRSLVAPLTWLWLILAWTILPGSSVLWTLAIFSLLMIPPYAHATSGLIFHPRGIPWTSNFWNVWGNFWTNAAQVFLVICFLPHQAYLQSDAVARTLYRQFISKKCLLEWTSAASADQRSGTTIISLGGFIWASPLLSLMTCVSVILFAPSSLLIAGPFLFLWFFFPITTQWISKPRIPRVENLSAGEKQEVLLLARRTWGFFETFVSEKTHWLPPDNVQFNPKTVIAERTSPTNIGLLLLSTTAAQDLGFITPLECLERIERTVETMKHLERFHGHFLNWYDTASLSPLEPRYVSTVDSGNLAGHLISVKHALLDLSKCPTLSESHFHGFSALLEILGASLEMLERECQEPSVTRGALLLHAIRSWKNLFSERAPDSASGWREPMEKVRPLLEEVLKYCERWQTGAFSKSAYETGRHVQSALDTIAAWERQFALQSSIDAQTAFSLRCHTAAGNCQKFIFSMDFTSVFDEKRKIFSIGLHVNDGRRDDSYYDLLASEARLASFVAIGMGQIPQVHWFHLGRQLTSLHGKRVLVSWSASMFEYLMPLLVMRHYPNTLLHETHFASVAIQISYGKHRNVPWGVSESGYNARDLQQNYQYGPFGVPGIGLKRGLREDLVVAPYATALAALVLPRNALKNFRRMEIEGWRGDFGFFEATDYTKNRVLPGRKFAIVQSFMAHHQGMSLCALANVLRENILQNRFHNDAMVASTEVLLQERVPQKVEIQYPRREELTTEERLPKKWEEATRRISSAAIPHPKTQVLSNGNYTVMLSSAGSGFSRCGELAVTRWTEDPNLDNSGSYIYLRDQENGISWSATQAPIGKDPDTFEATFSEHKAEFRRKDGHIHTHLEVVVSPEDNVELRQITISNRSLEKRELELTSYLEPVLLKPEADLAHMAFGKLFFQTEFIDSKNAVLGHRRPRLAHEKESWAFHLLVGSLTPLHCEHETDRLRFIGRNRTLTNPLALEEKTPLSGTVGNVLDPIFSLRTLAKLHPEGSAKLCFVTGVAESRDEALRLIDRYHETSSFDRESDMAWTKSQMETRHLNVSADDANLYQEIASVLFYSSRSLRPPQDILRQSTLSLPSLWANGISGDLPILVVRATTEHDLPLVRQLIRCHEYLRMKQIRLDLVILNDEQTTYRMALQDEVLQLIRGHGIQNLLTQKGGLFVLRTDLISCQDKLLIESVARAVFTPERGPLKEQVRRLGKKDQPLSMPLPIQRVTANIGKSEPLLLPTLECFNGYGGFTEGGREYAMKIEENISTPAPWSNVIANEKGFGFLITESGGGYTWSANSRENKLTPWSNDPVIDQAGEILYLRDEETGELWTPTPRPIRTREPYLIRHGQGYSTFEHNSHGISHSLNMFVPLDEEVKVFVLRLKNTTGKIRHLSAYFFIEWVLGTYRSRNAHHIRTESGSSPGIILAQNPLDPEFGKRVAFASGLTGHTSYTCDRREFLGRNGSYMQPLGAKQITLANRSGLGLDPCAALQSRIDLEPGAETELIFLLGQSDSSAKAESIINVYSQRDHADQALQEVKKFWDSTLGAVQVRTPDADVNFLFNRWLLYQTLSCRIWGRTGFYQAGGAFGFRDQLQDVLALTHSRPSVVRQHIVEAARHQFLEGDVLHWWHPPTGRGVRTHISDDLLWLPYSVCRYVSSTGDSSILDENASFIKGPELSPDQEDFYFHPETSEIRASVYEHCKRAIDRSLKVGPHGLPLMGGGDWNDGMNRVGHGGKGESVWLAWFLAQILGDFVPLCERRGLSELADAYRKHRDLLVQSIENHGWDGDWYRRAYFDNGTPLGSKKNQECQIDSIAQSWAVLSGLGNKSRAPVAMKSVQDRLILKDAGLVLLFAPPFFESTLDPGYVKGYVPGVRENGGQYTHAAIWSMMAFASLGDKRVAGEVFSLLNPFRHSASRAEAEKYKVEPYVIAADIYGSPPHVGRGGWTWYTGSAAWYYRAGIEYILGMRREGDLVRFFPCAPESWKQYEIDIRLKKSTYEIIILNSPSFSHENLMIELDGRALEKPEFRLIDDGLNHAVRVSGRIKEAVAQDEKKQFLDI